jgi:4-amino-4-deoxy-L-arabinose transferase-like glycosyltransferase
MSWKQYFYRLLNPANKLNPYWLCFCFFSFSNIFIAYGRGDLETNLFVAFYGIVIPGIFCFYLLNQNTTYQDGEKTQIFLKEGCSVSAPPIPLWFSFGLLLLLTRFYKLESVPLWPSKDDGHFGILGIALSQKWSWQLLWGECQNQPLVLWMLAFYFKWVEPSLFSLRLFSALVSMATVLLGYWAARQFFSKGYALILTFLLAFNFWALISSRLCIGAITVIPLEYAAFGAMGRCLKNLKVANRFRYQDILILGILSGLGFYTYAVWPVVFLSISIVVFFQAWKHPRNKAAFFFYVLTVLLISTPLLLAYLSKNGTVHLQDEFLRQSLLSSTANYFQMFFWKGGYCFNGPVWGGVFNPFEGALIFLGVVSLILDFKKTYSQWILLTGFLFILPGILSNTVEICHVVQLFPLFSLIAVLGIQKITAGLPSALRWKGTVVLLLVILILNLYHWLGPFQSWNSLPPEQKDWVPIEYYQAYKIIKEKSLQSGPVDVFSEFTLDFYNKTLNIACFPLDALQNPRLASSTPVWSALLANKYYIPFLKKRFPRSEWFLLKKDDIRYHSDLALGLIPNDSMKPDERDAWRKADRVLRDLNLQLKAKTSPVPWTEIKNLFLESSKAFENDPFLSSVFSEKIALLDANRIDYGDTAQDFQRALRFGYPAANLYYDLEMSLEMNGRVNEAKRVLKEAVQAQRRFSSSESNL